MQHPAPFPKTQHYPDNKGKAIPPKPALKGSKNQSGGIFTFSFFNNYFVDVDDISIICIFRTFAYLCDYL